MALSLKQRKFCEFYAANGNATESAKLAGYSAKTASETGFENLRKPQIQEHLKTLTKPDSDDLIADAIERQRFLTQIMRGEIKDTFDKEIGEIAKTADRINACKELSKLQCDYAEPVESKERTIIVNLKQYAD
jgi:phage terminase small subunit